MTHALKIMAASAVLSMAACSGGSSSGAGTADSPFVGTYKGAGTVRVKTDTGSAAVNENVTVFVHRDGLVQVGETQSTIYASGPLNGDNVRITEDASVLIDPACTGTVVLDGSFTFSGDDGAVFRGRWSSRDASCFGTAGEVSGPVTVERASVDARASRVFETGNPAIFEAFRAAAG